MEPSTDAQPGIAFVFDDDLLNGMKALSGLHLEEDELVPTRGDSHRRHRFGLRDAVLIHMDRIELESAAIFSLPLFVVGEGHVKDVGHTACTDDIVVVEEVTPLGIRIDGHVLLDAGERTAACDRPEEIAKLWGIERIAEGEEVGEQLELGVGEIGERGQIASLVHLVRPHSSNGEKGRSTMPMRERESQSHLVDVGLLLRERKLEQTLVFDATQKFVLKEFFDDDVLEGCAACIACPESLHTVIFKQSRMETRDVLRTVRRGGVADFRTFLTVVRCWVRSWTACRILCHILFFLVAGEYSLVG